MTHDTRDDELLRALEYAVILLKARIAADEQKSKEDVFMGNRRFTESDWEGHPDVDKG